MPDHIGTAIGQLWFRSSINFWNRSRATAVPAPNMPSELQFRHSVWNHSCPTAVPTVGWELELWSDNYSFNLVTGTQSSDCGSNVQPGWNCSSDGRLGAGTAVGQLRFRSSINFWNRSCATAVPAPNLPSELQFRHSVWNCSHPTAVPTVGWALELWSDNCGSRLNVGTAVGPEV